jgi:ketosteroid isomerase-like protein
MNEETRSEDIAIRRLFSDYAEALDDADAEAVTDLFTFPATIWQLGEGHVFEDAEELSENVEALVDVFNEAGIVLSVPEVLAVEAHGTGGFASVAWRQESVTGEALHEFICQYLLLRGEDGWRIATVVNDPAGQA